MRPSRLDGELHHAAQRQPEGNREAGAQVALAVAAGDAVDGQHHDVDAGLLGALASWRGSGRGPCGSRTGRPAACRSALRSSSRLTVPSDDTPNIVPNLGRGRRHGALALVVKEPLQRGRRAIERASPASGPCTVTDMSISPTPRSTFGHQVAALEARGVAPIGHLVVGGAVDVVEDRARQAPPGQPAEVVKVVTVFQAHIALRPMQAGHRHGSRCRPVVYRPIALPCRSSPAKELAARRPGTAVLTGVAAVDEGARWALHSLQGRHDQAVIG